MNEFDYLDFSIWGVLIVEVACSLFVLKWWSKLNRSGRLAGGWLLAATAFGVLGKVARYAIQNSLIVTFFWFPVSAILAFNALASMHGPGRSRTGLRLLSWLLVGAWALLAVTIETPGEYSRATSPLHAIMLAAAAAYTLITRVEASRTDLVRDPVFVVAAFWVIYCVPTVFLSVAARFWMTAQDSTQLLNYYSFRNTVVMISYSAMIYGIHLFVAARPRLGEPIAGRTTP